MSAISLVPPSQPAPMGHQSPYSVTDFLAFGEHHGIAYHFPALPLPARQAQPEIQRVVVRGRIEELELRNGLRLTSSNLDVLQHYESTSLQTVPLFITVILEGMIHVCVGEHVLRLGKGMAFSTRLGDARALHVLQPPGQHLQTLNLAFGSEILNATVRQNSRAAPYHWRVPHHLLSALADALHSTWSRDLRQLLLEGLALQLLAHGLHSSQTKKSATCLLSPSEWRRLYAVRQALHDSPAQPHTLQSLATMAAMSPSSLRHKFRLAFGQPVFDYLRECRLSRAREYLQQGFNVQQTALLVGYRHSTNFATAFRRHFGVPPSDMP